MDKTAPSANAAVSAVSDSMMVASGGFGICGIPAVLLEALSRTGVRDLTVVSNNCGIPGIGNSLLLENRQIRRLIASYVGENKELERQYLTGEVEIELTPQGTLAERLRAGGAGIAAFYTQTGIRTQVADGGLPLRHDADGAVAVASAPKPQAEFVWDGAPRTFVLEEALRPDVRSCGPGRAIATETWCSARHRATSTHSVRWRRSTPSPRSRTSSIPVTSTRTIHLPGIYVDAVLPLTVAQAADKGIERRTVRELEEVSA